jgi:hypothetical protein
VSDDAPPEAVDALFADLLRAGEDRARARERLSQCLDEQVLLAVLRRAVPVAFLEQVAATPGLIVLRTLSKAHGLAGARCGVGIAHPQVIALILAYLPPEKASELLSNLPDSIQTEVSVRVTARYRVSRSTGSRPASLISRINSCRRRPCGVVAPASW